MGNRLRQILQGKGFRNSGRSQWVTWTAELYNLKTDLAEQTNLISKHPEIAERLKQQLLSVQDRKK